MDAALLSEPVGGSARRKEGTIDMASTPDGNTQRDSSGASEVARRFEQDFRTLSKSEQEDVRKRLGIQDPSQAVSDKIWLLIVWSLSIVLVGAFVVLSVGMLWQPAPNASVKPELVFAVFTSVVGFLGGLFVPNSTTVKR